MKLKVEIWAVKTSDQLQRLSFVLLLHLFFDCLNVDSKVSGAGRGSSV